MSTDYELPEGIKSVKFLERTTVTHEDGYRETSEVSTTHIRREDGTVGCVMSSATSAPREFMDAWTEWRRLREEKKDA